MFGSRKAQPLQATSRGNDKPRLFTLEVRLIAGPISERFAKKNRVVSRTIQIRGDQTLADLHDAIFGAFDRWDEHMYEFQFGAQPMDRKARRYGLEEGFGFPFGKARSAGRVDRTRIDSLGLAVGQSFYYWFDFGDDWWHQINVAAIDENAAEGKFPAVTKRVGKSPRQYPDQ